MPRAARREYVLESDEESDEEYTPIEVVEPPRRRSRSRNRLAVRITDEHDRAPSPRVRPTRVYQHQSYQQPHHYTYATPEPVVIENTLNVPQIRQRSSSTGAAPQPNFLGVYVQPSREPSRERTKHYYHHEHYSESSSDDGRSHRRDRARPRRKSRSRSDGERLSAETIRKLAELEVHKHQADLLHKQQVELRQQAELRQQTELRHLKERDRRERDEYSPATAARLAELEAIKRRKEREDEEAAVIAKIEARERHEKEKRRQLMLQYEKEQEEAEKAEQEMIAKAEAKRRTEEDRITRERERALLEERERLAKKAAEAKIERERIIAEEKLKEQEAEQERRRIIQEEEDRKKKEKDKEEALRKRILAEEAERIAKERAKKKEEEEEFQMKVRERFMRAGYSADYIDDVLEQKQLVRSDSRRTQNQLAIDMGRPTFIRVQEKHLLPETLDYYRLPWEYDAADRRYIVIKQYITHEFQQELFKHTERIYKRRETKLITSGYEKDTVTTTTLKPKTDSMYMVRRKSEKSAKSPVGRHWMFT